MLYFKVKMHQIRFPLGLRPRPRWASLQRSPRLLYLRGLLLRGERGRGGKEGMGREEGGKGRGGDGRVTGPLITWWLRP